MSSKQSNQTRKSFPIVEIFESIQGEGHWAGTPMTFIRFAGCNVGKGSGPYTCTSWHGRQFPCDTDYTARDFYETQAIMEHVVTNRAQHVCLTGGEPLLYDLSPLTNCLQDLHYITHLETSGTHVIPRDMFNWVTVSPKHGYKEDAIREAHEIKILVDNQTCIEEIKEAFGVHEHKLFLQPVNDKYEINHMKVQRCLAMLKHLPHARLSIQLHKLIGER